MPKLPSFMINKLTIVIMKNNYSLIAGVFMNIVDLGILLTGESGIGKSETALSLIDRGHRLVADDAVEFYRVGQHVYGRCPTPLKYLLEVRELGIIDLMTLYGESAIAPPLPLSLIIELTAPNLNAFIKHRLGA